MEISYYPRIRSYC